MNQDISQELLKLLTNSMANQAGPSSTETTPLLKLPSVTTEEKGKISSADVAVLVENGIPLETALAKDPTQAKVLAEHFRVTPKPTNQTGLLRVTFRDTNKVTVEGTTDFHFSNLQVYAAFGFGFSSLAISTPIGFIYGWYLWFGAMSVVWTGFVIILCFKTTLFYLRYALKMRTDHELDLEARG